MPALAEPGVQAVGQLGDPAGQAQLVAAPGRPRRAGPGRTARRSRRACRPGSRCAAAPRAIQRRRCSTSRSHRSVPPRKTVPRRHVDRPGEHLRQGGLARAGAGRSARTSGRGAKVQADVAQRGGRAVRRPRTECEFPNRQVTLARAGARRTGSCGASYSSCTRPQAPSAYWSSGTIRLTCSTVAAEGQGEQPDRGEPGGVDPARWPAPSAAEHHARRCPPGSAPVATSSPGGTRRQTTRPRASTSAARRAYRRSTYGRARLVRTSSWPWIASSITAARSDQASSSAIRAGPIRAVGRRRPTASSTVSSSIATPAGHHTTGRRRSTTDDREALRDPTPWLRTAGATW